MNEKQLEIYGKIINLLLLPKLTSEERKYLQIAKQSMDLGKNFQDSINSLGRAFTTLDNGRYQQGGLTPEVKDFFSEIKVLYGDPRDHQFYHPQNNVTVIGGAFGTGGGSKGISKGFLIYFFTTLTVIILIILWMYGVL